MHLPNESSKGVLEAEASGATRQLSMHDNYSKVIHEDPGTWCASINQLAGLDRDMHVACLIWRCGTTGGDAAIRCS